MLPKPFCRQRPEDQRSGRTSMSGKLHDDRGKLPATDSLTLKYEMPNVRRTSMRAGHRISSSVPMAKYGDSSMDLSTSFSRLWKKPPWLRRSTQRLAPASTVLADDHSGEEQMQLRVSSPGCGHGSNPPQTFVQAVRVARRTSPSGAPIAPGTRWSPRRRPPRRP